MTKQLNDSTLKGIRWTTFSSVITAFLHLSQIIILSRFLTKSEFGLASLSIVVLGFAQTFVDMGFSNAIIHKQNSSESQLGTLYWMNFIAGIIVANIIYFSSGSIASFYNEPGMVPLLKVISICFVIIPLGLQFKVLFQRDLRFNLLAIQETIGALFGFVAALYFAINNYGAFSIVNGYLFNILITNFLFLTYGVRKYPVKLVFKLSEVKEYIRFGMFQTGEKTINYFNTQFDVMIIGKILGAETVGVYSISKQLVLRPAQVINPIVTRVSFPVMSILQNDLIRIKSIYMKTINFLSSVNFPIYLGIFLLSEEIVLLLFGENWTQAISVVKILSLYAALRSTINPIGSLTLAMGRVDIGFFWNLIVFFTLPFAVYIGTFFGLDGVCFALVIYILLLFIPNWRFQVSVLCGAGFREYHLEILKPLVLTLIASIAPIISLYFIDNLYVRILAVSILGTVSAGIVNYLFNKPFYNMIKKLIKSTS